MSRRLRLPSPGPVYNKRDEEETRRLIELEFLQLPDATASTSTPGGESVTESITLHAPGNLPLELTQQPAALTNYLVFHRPKYDASWANKARVIVDVKTAGATDAVGVLQWSPTFADDDWRSAGRAGDIKVHINTAGIRVGSGLLASAAILGGDVYWRVVWRDGDGTESPQIGNVFLQFLRGEEVIAPPVTLYLRDTAPSASPSAQIEAPDVVDIYGCGVRDVEELQVRISGTPTIAEYDLVNQAQMETDGWLFSTPSLNAWIALSGPGGSSAIGNSRAGMMNCCGTSQDFSRTITIPATTVGTIVRTAFKNDGGFLTVIGYPGQCPPLCTLWPDLVCDDIGAGLAVVYLDEDGNPAGGVGRFNSVAWYYSDWDLGSPWSEMYATIPPGIEDVTISVSFAGSDGDWRGVGSCGFIVSAVQVSELPQPKVLSLIPGIGTSVKTIETMSPYEARQAAGGLGVGVSPLLKLQTMPAGVVVVRGAAKVSRGARYCGGHAQYRLYVWRESTDEVLAEIGTGISPLLDGEMREYTIEIDVDEYEVDVADARICIEISGSIDASCDGRRGRTEGAGIVVEYDGTDESFADGQVSLGAATQVSFPGLLLASAVA